MKCNYAVLGYRPQRNLVNALKRGIALSSKGGFVKAIFNRQTNEVIGYVASQGKEILVGPNASWREDAIMHKLATKLDMRLSRKKNDWQPAVIG